MNTAIAITAIIAVLLLANSIVVAIRDVAKARHQARHCNGCTCTNNKENSA
ncbi:MAG TPA: hypothetical protein VIP28_10630 [Nocardioides sp.]